RITTRKLRRAGQAPRLVRGDVFQLPFESDSVDSIVMTFPPGFIALPSAVREMHRVLREDGRVVVVDAGWVKRPGFVSALINLAFRFTGTTNFEPVRFAPLRDAGFTVSVYTSGDAHSTVQVLVAAKARVSTTKEEDSDVEPRRQTD
ncbi:MAG: methyltransferase domain-containing protein, partial [Chloroflexi bacterium]|nr:methyltransferase domain-containing protein [Chloroflexota bacterium]